MSAPKRFLAAVIAAALVAAGFPGEASATLARIPEAGFPSSVLALSPGLIAPPRAFPQAAAPPALQVIAPARASTRALVLPASAPSPTKTAGLSASLREPLESDVAASRSRFDGSSSAASHDDSRAIPVMAPAAARHAGHFHASLRASPRGLSPERAAALKLSISVGAATAAVEFAGGALTGTPALQADALHLISDRALDAGVLLAAWVARRAPHSYGWLKSEALVPFAGALALAGISLAMIPGEIAAFRHPAPVAGWSVIGFAALSAISNLISAAILRDHHGHIGVRGAFQHALADAAGTFLVMIAGAAGLLFGWTILMPFATGVLIAMLLRVAWNMGRPAWGVLAVPSRAER